MGAKSRAVTGGSGVRTSFFLFFPPLAPLPTKATKGDEKKDVREDGTLGPVVGADPSLLLPIPPRPPLQKALALADIDRPNACLWLVD